MNNRLNRLAVPIGIVGIVLLLVVPVPAPLLDFLIVCNILLALLVLLTSMFVKKPLDFSVFPSLLLVATLFRLGLNVASTRLVLGNGYAGQVIEAFGKVTVGGSMIIGAVVFLKNSSALCALAGVASAASPMKAVANHLAILGTIMALPCQSANSAITSISSFFSTEARPSTSSKLMRGGA